MDNATILRNGINGRNTPDVLLSREQSNIEAVKNQALGKYHWRDYKGALEDWNRAYEIEPNDAQTLKNRGEIKQILGDHRGALEDLNKADRIEPNDAFTLSTRGNLKRMLGDYKGALEDLNRADEIEPNDAFTLRNRGATKQKLGDFKGALEDLNRAEEIEPNDIFVLFYRGITKRMLGDYKGSLEDLNRADKIKPNKTTLQHRGETKRMLGDNKGALEDLNRANEIEPNDAYTLRNRGATKYMLDDYQGALEDLNRADEIWPNNPFTLQNRGATKRLLGDYQGALEDFNRADEMEPNDAFTLEQRAIVRYHLNDFLKAFDDITLVLKFLPNSKTLLDWKSKIEEKIKQIKPVVISDSNQKALKADKIMSNKPQNATQQSNTAALPVIQEGIIQVPFSELKVLQPLIGEGGFGEVSLAEWRGINVALKKLKENVAVDDISHEAKTLMLFHYKFIVNLMAITTDPATNNTILVMEYMKHGSLEDLLFKQHIKLSRASVIRLALDIALGVNYLHSHNPKVLHRDLKSANVLLYRNKTRAKIADFGTAKFLHPNVQAKTIFGNASIAMPPEMLAEEIYDEKVDVFAFGVILYEMLTNKRLPQLEEIHRAKRIRENINDGKLMQLVLDCCATDPTKRPHVPNIIKLLRTMKSEPN